MSRPGDQISLHDSWMEPLDQFTKEIRSGSLDPKDYDARPS